MSALNAIYPNSRTRSRGKSSLVLAAKIAHQVGMVPTWPNVQTIRLAIESEAEQLKLSVVETAEMIVAAAKERTSRQGYSCPSSWEIREMAKLNTINRFWFEDALWRGKRAFAAMEVRLCQERGISFRELYA